jgi:predicted nucleic acid-binding protein
LFGVTADTNIYISAFEFGGLPRTFLDLAPAGMFRLRISEAIRREVLRVLRDKFKYSPDELVVVEEKLAGITLRVSLQGNARSRQGRPRRSSDTRVRRSSEERFHRRR